MNVFYFAKEIHVYAMRALFWRLIGVMTKKQYNKASYNKVSKTFNKSKSRESKAIQSILDALFCVEM